jgi:hypothetical protein
MIKATVTAIATGQTKSIRANASDCKVEKPVATPGFKAALADEDKKRKLDKEAKNKDKYFINYLIIKINEL